MVKCGNFIQFHLLKWENTKQLILKTLIGTYECKVDAKGRLMLPVSLKSQLNTSLTDGFVLKRSLSEVFRIISHD